MNILLDRKYKKDAYTISNVYINGKWFCNAIEDKDRNLDDAMPLADIRRNKIYGETAIPRGTYKVDMDTISPKYAKKNAAYTRPYGHKMPRLKNVKGFEGILIHAGTTAQDSFGCIIVGENKAKGKVINSQATWKRLMDTLLKDKDNITITIC